MLNKILFDSFEIHSNSVNPSENISNNSVKFASLSASDISDVLLLFDVLTALSISFKILSNSAKFGVSINCFNDWMSCWRMFSANEKRSFFTA